MTTPKTWHTPGGEVQGFYLDLLKQSHVLVAGTTGCGKSTLINSLLCTALYYPPEKHMFILIDPKRVELSPWKKTPHVLLHACERDDIVKALKIAVELMDERYEDMEAKGIKTSTDAHIWVIVDEFADLMTTDRDRVEPLLVRLAQLGRAANIHLLLATQAPHRAVITAPIKLNMTATVALRCREAIESRLIMGCKGAETLPMYGEGYYMTPEYRQPIPVAIPRISEDECDAMIQWWAPQRAAFFGTHVP